jgi:hypothetical protein
VQINCNEGLLTLEAYTGAAVRRARLTLSDGHTIVSRVFQIPKRLGGPVGVYYEVVRGPRPIPVSLTELDAHGRVLRVLKVHSLVECTRHPLKDLPGGVRTVVSDRVPDGGPPFSIRSERYRFLAHVYLDFHISVEEEGSATFGGFAEGSSEEFLTSPRKPSAFSPDISNGCLPHPYEILYGLLAHPRDTVLAGASGRRRPVRCFTRRRAHDRSGHASGGTGMV